MAVTIVPMPQQSSLSVEGDIQALLAIPAEPPEPSGDGGTLVDTYYISLSDGSLIQASNHHDEPEFEVVVEGAGRVTIDKDRKSLSVDWTIEWINLASNRASTALARQTPRPLPLFEALSAIA